LKQHQPWLDEEYSILLGQRKQAKLQWLQNQSQVNGDDTHNLNVKFSEISKRKESI
jgi:hypothetical protein